MLDIERLTKTELLNLQKEIQTKQKAIKTRLEQLNCASLEKFKTVNFKEINVLKRKFNSVHQKIRHQQFVKIEKLVPLVCCLTYSIEDGVGVVNVESELALNANIEPTDLIEQFKSEVEALFSSIKKMAKKHKVKEDLIWNIIDPEGYFN